MAASSLPPQPQQEYSYPAQEEEVLYRLPQSALISSQHPFLLHVLSLEDGLEEALDDIALLTLILTHAHGHGTFSCIDAGEATPVVPDARYVSAYACWLIACTPNSPVLWSDGEIERWLRGTSVHEKVLRERLAVDSVVQVMQRLTTSHPSVFDAREYEPSTFKVGSLSRLLVSRSSNARAEILLLCYSHRRSEQPRNVDVPACRKPAVIR